MAGAVLHFVSALFRVHGSASLNLTMYSLDNARFYTAKPLAVINSPGVEPTRIINFRTQKGALEMRITKRNEYAKIDKVVIFAKPVAQQLPG